MVPGSVLGHPVRRREDPRLVTGAGCYVDDVPVESGFFAVFVRSTVAHARLRGIDTSPAERMPGVIGVFTADALGLPAEKGFPGVPDDFVRPPLAKEVVRFVGEPLAVVVAGSRAQAVDAAAAVTVDYEPLPAVVDPEAAVAEGAPLLFPSAGTNVCYRVEAGQTDQDVLAEAEVVVRARMVNQRLAPVPLEPNGLVAAPDPESGGLKVWASCQGAFQVRDAIAAAVGLEPSKVRVIAQDVGGGFGPKMMVYPEQVIVAVLAARLGRPVRWVETRTDNLMTMGQGRGQVQEVELGARRDGTFVGMRVRVLADAGAYPGLGAWLPTFTGMMVSGVYRIPRIDYRATSVVTNTPVVTAYRGAGRPEATSLIERVVDMMAAELGLDPAELRRRNLFRPEEFPLTTATGGGYDSGDYARALDQALELARYQELRREQAARRERGASRLLGIGLSTYVEVTGGGAPQEHGSVEVRPDGSVLVLSGTGPTGQGHATTYAQLVAERLGVPMERVEVVYSDTGRVPSGYGTVGSRSMQMGGAAIAVACSELIDRARQLAAELLEADPADIEITEGGLGVRGVPTRAVPWSEVAARAGEGGLVARVDYRQQGFTFPFGAHVAVVEVDVETGEARLVRYVAVDDCGHVLNPLLAEGQVHGGIAQGAAQALFEEVVFDAEGNPRTTSLLDYGMPTANELPAMELGRTVTPTPLNPLGVKGIGESGTIGSGAAVQNAVVDALAHLGIRHLDMPLTPEKVWNAIRAARASRVA
ncbi:MAG TPA: xanthine dehydrogenase family protein molybdopterin-binding subunit [Candidatus Dormibacteraeota bacterium]|nr:xanthine dehydrogenase family protein molybdopterin-binding subunit [Candidatus Dormibacteraeota bacterium]